MAVPEQRFLVFHSSVLGEDDLMVTAFTGHEELARPYEFVIDLVAHRHDLDLRSVLDNPAYLGIKQALKLGDGSRGLHTRKIWGRVYEIRQTGAVNDLTTYQVVLVPELWKLSLSHRSRVFQETSIPDIVAEILQEHGMSTDRFEFRGAREYPAKEYVVQYGESDLDFVQRWLEHEGIFYFFEQTDDGEKIVFADSSAAYQPISEDTVIPFKPELAGDETRAEVGDASAKDWFKEEVIHRFGSVLRTVTSDVILNEFDWTRPDQDMQVTTRVTDKGLGTYYEYHGHYKDPELDGRQLARVRSEEILTRAQQYTGVGDCRAFHPGRTFQLSEHPRADFNTDQLLLRVEHNGSQSIGMTGGGTMGASYGNEFVTMPAGRTFRPARSTRWPKITGLVYARIDGPDGSKTAQIDPLGRYKVKLPFDLSDAREGTASRYIRMAQPYSGVNSGMHFPLHVGTEVLLSHIDGDPDRPIIVGSIPNPETASPVNSAAPDRNRIRTASGCVFEIKDAHLQG